MSSRRSLRRAGGSSSGKTARTEARTSSTVCRPSTCASCRMSSASRGRAASAFIASRCSGEAAKTRRPGWSNTREAERIQDQALILPAHVVYPASRPGHMQRQLNYPRSRPPQGFQGRRQAARVGIPARRQAASLHVDNYPCSPRREQQARRTPSLATAVQRAVSPRGIDSQASFRSSGPVSASAETVRSVSDNYTLFMNAGIAAAWDREYLPAVKGGSRRVPAGSGKLELLIAEVGDQFEGTAEGSDKPAQDVLGGDVAALDLGNPRHWFTSWWLAGSDSYRSSRNDSTSAVSRIPLPVIFLAGVRHATAPP